jgi:hypothetical protein
MARDGVCRFFSRLDSAAIGCRRRLEWRGLVLNFVVGLGQCNAAAPGRTAVSPV